MGMGRWGPCWLALFAALAACLPSAEASPLQYVVQPESTDRWRGRQK